MKQISIVLAFLFFIAAHVAFADSADILFNGSDLSPAVHLKEIEKHTLYNTVAVPSTCYRNEQHGTKTECHTETTRSCHLENRCRPVVEQFCRVVGGHRVCNSQTRTVCHLDDVCQNFPRQVCATFPNIVQVPYACTKYEQVPVGEETDYNVEADLALKFDAVPQGVQAQERLNVSLDGEKIQTSATQVSNQVLLIETQNISIQTVKEKAAGQPGEKKISGDIAIKVIPVKDLVLSSAAPISDISLNKDVLKFSTGKIALPELLQVTRLDIDRDIRFWPDKTLFDDAVPASAVSVQASGDRSIVSISIPALKADEEIQSDHLYHIWLNVAVTPANVSGLLNPGSLPAASELSVEDQEVEVK